MVASYQVKPRTSVGGRVFGLGHVPAPGHRFTSFRIALAGRSRATLPTGGIDYAPILPPVYDQGPTGSCEGHAASAGIAGAFAQRGVKLSFAPSMAQLYKLALCVDRAPQADGSLPPLADVGTMGNSIIRGFQEWGVKPLGPLASDGRYSDADPATLLTEPSLDDLEEDATWRLVGAYSILDNSANDVADAYIQALLNFGPIPTASFVDTAFMQWTPSQGPIGVPNQNDPNGGGHKILVVGVKMAADGSRVWKVRNSWGTSWGDGGYFYASDAWLAQTDEREVYDVKRVTA